MGLKETYSGIEEKYYNFMDGLDKTGIPVYKIIDFFESKNIPSFPLFIIFLILISSGVYFLFIGGGILTGTTQFELTITDNANLPIKEVSLTYYFNKEKKTSKTDDKGKAVIEVISGKDFTVTAEKKGYKKTTKTFNSGKEKKATIVLTASTLDPIKVQLIGNGNELLTEEIRVRFSCTENSEWNETVNFTTGTTELTEVPADCGKIIAQPTGKKCTEDCDFSSDSSTIKIYLDKEDTEKGTISFTLMDKQANLLQGIEILVIPVGSTIAEDSCSTYNGMCSAEIPFGAYYIRTTDLAGKWKDYDSREQGINVNINSNNQNINFEEIILEEGVIGEIKIRIKNSEGNPIENALVKLFKDGTEIRQQRTDFSGETIFNIAEQIDYAVSVTHGDYLNSGSMTVSPKTEFYEIALNEATASNTRAINVSVLDEKGKPVENTKVFLKDASTLNIIGEEKITGFDGKAVFDRIKEGEYLVRAEKRGFEGKDSRKIIIKEKEPQNVSITLNIGQGALKVMVLDKEKQPIQSATVKVKDYFTGKEYAVYSTDTEGKKSFNIRADKKVFLEVSESSHADYISAPIQMFDGTEEKTIVLEDSINSFSIKLEELKLEGQTLENKIINQGKTYKAIFKLMIPRGVFSNEAGAHIRTGADTKNYNNTMEKDDLYIKKISAANAKIIKGTTFNPNTGYGTDSSHLTSGNAKWANIIFNSVKEGTYEIEIIIQVKESLSGSPLEIAYRGWVIDSGYQRDPFDEELQETESTGVKESLYAEARHKPLRIGASSLCSENFCTAFTVRDIANATRTNIIDSFPAEISSKYELEFNIISINERAYSNSELVIEGKGLNLNSYEIEGSEKQAQGKITIPTGTISKGQKISGKVKFTTKTEGTNRIDLSLFGESLNLGKEKILFKPIRAEVALAKNMEIVTAPKNLVPFIVNHLLVKVTEEETDLSEVTIKIEKDNERIAIGKTDSKGIFAYAFEPMSAGTKIKITAEKAGFNPVEKEITVSKSVVSFSPFEIHESFNAKKPARRVTRDITLKNITEMPLTIRDVELTDSFKGLINVEMQAYAGTDLLIGSEEQILVSLGLTEKGRKITQLTSVSGEIIIVFENLDVEKQWTASVPVKITIGLGGEVDSTDCFSVNPNAWNALTQKNKKEIKLVLINSCTVEGENIALKNIKAKVVWKENAIGDFELNSTIEGAKTISLKNTNQLLSETFNPKTDEEENLELTFRPDEIPLGSGTATIYLEAVNPTEKGEQKLKQKIEVNVQISKLSSCLRIKPNSPQLRIQMNYYNQGWGQISQYSGYAPQNTLPYLMNPNTLSTLNRNFPYSSYPYDPTASPGSVANNRNVVAAGDWRGQQWPHTQYLAPFSNPGAYNPALNYQFGSGAGLGYGGEFPPPSTGRIEIENSCPSPVQIEVEGTPEVSVSTPTLILKSGESKTVEATPTIFIGQYPLIIRAKHTGSTDTAVEIARYNVLIESEFGRNYYDCISLSKRVFEFNDIIQRPVEGTVWNSCYDLGVILNYNSIPRDLSGGGKYNYPSDFGVGKERLESSKIVDSIELIQLVNTPGSDGKIIQKLKFRMWKNFDYYKINEIELPTNQNPLLELANLRIQLTGLYYKVETEEILPVTFIDRTGIPQIIPFYIIIEDLWALAEQGIIDFGNPNIEHQACIDEGALQFIEANKQGTNEKGYFAEEVFQNGILDIDSQKVVMKNKNLCGDTDRLSRIINNRIELDSGVTLLFNIDKGDSIKLRIDKRNINCDPGTINGTLYVRLSRANPAKTETVSVPYSLRLDLDGLPKCTEKDLTQEQKMCKEGIESDKTVSEEIQEILDDKTKNRQTKIDEITKILEEVCSGLDEQELEDIAKILADEAKPAEIKACSQGGNTGETVYEKYGFDKIKFDWDWSSIKENECDEGNPNYIYCDSAQTAIELNKKAKNIDRLGVLEVDQQCIGFCEEEVRDSENLFRFLIKKTPVKDETTGTVTNFFIDNAYSIIAGKKFSPTKLSNESSGKLGLISEWLSSNLSGNSKTVTELVDEIIQEIESNPSLEEESIIGEIDSTKISSKGKLEAIGADKTEGSANKYVLTFNEYKEFRNKLKACIEGNKNAVECEIDKTKGTGTIFIGLEFMRTLQQNIEFKTGIRNIKDISLQEKTKIMKEGKVNVVMEQTLEEFYNENIEFEAYLKKDAFSDDFKTDFKEEYSRANDSFEEWRFTGSKAFDSGKFKIKFNYDWDTSGKDNTKITITKLTGLSSDYRKNYLFSVPFDGKVGVKDYTKRTGYGTDYGSDSTVNNIYLTEEIPLKGNGGVNSALKKLTNTKRTNTFKEARNRRIIGIKGSEFTFTPSKAIGLTAELKTGKSGVFYDLINGPKDDDSVIGIKEEKGLSYLFNWTAGKDKKQEENKLSKTDSACKTKRFGIIFDENDKKTQKTLSFVPAGWGYTFAKQCNKGIKSIAGYAFDEKGNVVKTDLPGTSIFNSGTVPSDIKEKTNLGKWIADIKKEKVCVTTSSSEFKLEWNKEKLMKEMIIT